MTTASAVVSYFDQFLGSTEKEEWKKLTAREKQQFKDRTTLAPVDITAPKVSQVSSRSFN